MEMAPLSQRPTTKRRQIRLLTQLYSCCSLGSNKSLLIGRAGPLHLYLELVFSPFISVLRFSVLRLWAFLFWLLFFTSLLFPAGHWFFVMLFDFKKNWNFSARKFRARSRLNFCGTLLFNKYLCLSFKARSTLLFDTTFLRNFDNLLIATRIYTSLCKSSGRGLANPYWTSSLGSSTGSIGKNGFFLMLILCFHLAVFIVSIFEPSER